MKISIFIAGIFERMKKNIFLLIVLLNSVALIGLFTTQVFWIREAYNLLNDQFSASVKVALKGVVNQMLEYELKQGKKIISNESDSLSLYQPDIRNLEPGLLAFKINEEFSCMEVGDNYEYAIIDKRDKSFIMGNCDLYKDELIESVNRVALTGFNQSEHYYLTAWFPQQHQRIINKLFRWIVISIIFVLALVIGFPISLFIFNRQKRLTGMKSDFINNMTHEFKTPIATISLASEMLLKKSIVEDSEKTRRYAKIIFDENTRLQNHVEQILSVSMLERGQFRLKKKEINVHELIAEVIEKFTLTIKNRDGILKTHFCADRFIISADKAHLTNALTNLLDNANKYSPEKPWVRIGTQNTENALIITIEDKGIGISIDDQQNVFKNLYRVPTGNLYNVKGFGIGLFYVKTIIEAHGGHINLKSELNKGSRFDIFLPYN